MVLSTKANWQAVERLRGTLVVSCQAADDEPLNRPEHILALSLSAVNGGARGLRLEGAANVAFVRKATDLPIIGLVKSATVPDSERLGRVYITASFAEAEEIAAAGCDIIAADGTARPRPDGLTFGKFVERVHDELNKPVWADVATLEEGLAAYAVGADLVSTTLYGYTEQTRLPASAPPNLDLLSALCEKLPCPVILEGRVWHPDEVAAAFARGAYAVVVGSAITRPQLITRRFVKAIPTAGAS